MICLSQDPMIHPKDINKKNVKHVISKKEELAGSLGYQRILIAIIDFHSQAFRFHHHSQSSPSSPCPSIHVISHTHQYSIIISLNLYTKKKKGQEIQISLCAINPIKKKGVSSHPLNSPYRCNGRFKIRPLVVHSRLR